MLINEHGKNLGEMETSKALELARQSELDLVEVFPKALPPVCKIMDYGKHQYQQSKQARLAQAKQKKTEIKGIRIGLKTDTHDMEFKKNQAEKFMSKGNKVKIDLFLRGREKMHQDLARRNIQNFISSISIPHKTEDPLKRSPNGFTTTIAPE